MRATGRYLRALGPRVHTVAAPRPRPHARAHGMPAFAAALGARGGVPARTYQFRTAKTTITPGAPDYSDSYSDRMVAECSKYSMKPVCEHPSYCGADSRAVYIGQGQAGANTGHISYPSQRTNTASFPSGWSAISSYWDDLCVYAPEAGTNLQSALCNVPTPGGSVSWRTALQHNPGFICATQISSFPTQAPTLAPTAGPTTRAPTRAAASSQAVEDTYWQEFPEVQLWESSMADTLCTVLFLTMAACLLFVASILVLKRKW